MFELVNLKDKIKKIENKNAKSYDINHDYEINFLVPNHFKVLDGCGYKFVSLFLKDRYQMSFRFYQDEDKFMIKSPVVDLTFGNFDVFDPIEFTLINSRLTDDLIQSKLGINKETYELFVKFLRFL